MARENNQLMSCNVCFYKINLEAFQNKIIGGISIVIHKNSYFLVKKHSTEKFFVPVWYFQFSLQNNT